MLSNVRIWLGQIISLLCCVLTLPFLYLLLTTEIAKQIVVYFVGQLGPELTKLLLEKDRNKFWLVFAKVIWHSKTLIYKKVAQGSNFEFEGSFWVILDLRVILQWFIGLSNPLKFFSGTGHFDGKRSTVGLLNLLWEEFICVVSTQTYRQSIETILQKVCLLLYQ